jgi:hypothetical protein
MGEKDRGAIATGLSRLRADAAGDEPTADLLTQRLTVHEQAAWMLRSLLEDWFPAGAPAPPAPWGEEHGRRARLCYLVRMNIAHRPA